MNTKLLLRVKRAILRHPRQFDMDYWFAKADNVPRCGTTACIAGWAITLHNKTNPLRAAKSVAKGGYFLPREKATELLRLDTKQAERLFYTSAWPAQFKSYTPSPELAARRIDHFIATNGQE